MKRYRSSFKPRSVRKLERKSKKNLVVTTIIGIALVLFLLTWGLPLLIGSLSVFNKLKPVEKVQSIKEDVSLAPPVLIIPYEATNSAAIKISGYASSGTQVQIYLDDELKETVDTRDDGIFTTSDIDLNLGTNNIYGKTITKEGKTSLASKNIRLKFSNEKPKLEVSEPSDNQLVKGGDKKIKVSGKTDPDNSITINGITVIVNNEGSFSKDVSINEGDNTISVVASDSIGNNTQVERKVRYEP